MCFQMCDMEKNGEVAYVTKEEVNIPPLTIHILKFKNRYFSDFVALSRHTLLSLAHETKRNHGQQKLH